MKTKNSQPAVWFLSLVISAVIFGGMSFFILFILPPQEGHSMAAKSGQLTKSKSHHKSSLHDDTKKNVHDEAHKKNHHKKSAHIPQPSTGHGTRWDYTGKIGPEHWGAIDEKFKICNKGRNQSPIDLTDWKNAGLASPIEFHYKKTSVNLMNNGHSLQSNVNNGSFMLVQGKRYTLAQFHFHAPSEHTVDGKHFPMEMHFVHKDSHGNLAALGVLIEEGSKNQLFSSFWQNLPALSKKSTETTNFSPVQLLPKDKSYHSYTGSVTTPPCVEGVKWHVMKTPIQLSFEQIESFRKVIGYNSRPVQPTYSRQSYLHNQ